MASIHAEAPVAIVDIGSNSVRLVVYSASTRIPSVIFNEKVMAGLGDGVAKRGRLTDEARKRALDALARYARLIDDMRVAMTRTVATAAVREAVNGEEFLNDVRAIGLDPQILSEKEEARMAGLGVISAIPSADGIVGDLGGGSLELVDVRGGEILASASLPLGVLRLDELLRDGESTFRESIAKAIEDAGLARAAQGRAFYLVGGSWRALARVELALTGHPLPITHQHVMEVGRPAELQESLRRLDPRMRGIPSLSASRIPTLPAANRLLGAVVETLAPDILVVSSFGIREGLLYDAIPAEARLLDPLLEAAREAGGGLGRFAQHGSLLDAWIAPVFDDDLGAARLRMAACLLADIAWATHPDFRAERGVDMALHGNWVAIDAPGRVMLALALFASFGGGSELPYPGIAGLCTSEQRRRAAAWGQAIRLGQRLSGGVAAGLEQTRLARGDGILRLELDDEAGPLVGETVERRLRNLASILGLQPEVSRNRTIRPDSKPRA